VGSKVFGPDFEGIKISGCTVSILKGALPADQKLPTAADEAPNKALELEGADMLSAVAKSAGTGDPLCIRVRLPAEAAVPRSDRELLPAYLPAAY
jgi:hypothetical protein